MNRTKKVVLNTLVAAVQMIVNQIISLTVSIKVLEVYGSDYHGLNAILSNIMTWILMIEGGLTTASTVALYKPFMKKEYDKCNAILSASRRRFIRIGGVIMATGICVAIVYPFFIKTKIPYWDICLMFIIMSFSTSFGVFYTRKYYIMYTVTQSEYWYELVSIIVSILGSFAIYFLACGKVNYLWIRTCYLVTTVTTGIILALLIRRKFRFLDFNTEPDFASIKGTKDVVAQKMTAVIRTSAPSLFISSMAGTTAASIYAVNIYSYNFIRTVVTKILTATQSGMGQVVAEKDRDSVYAVFRIYEYTATTIVVWLMSSAIVVTIPFVYIYTRNVEGVNYINYFLWLIIPLNYSVQLLHIPSGVIINMNAKFKEDWNFQIISIIAMVISMVTFGKFMGLNGIMLGVTVGSLVLGVQEIRYTRKYIFEKEYGELLKPILIDMLVLLPLMIVEYVLIPKHITIAMFLVCGILVTLIHGTAIFTMNYFFEKERMCSLIKRMSRMLKREGSRNDAKKTRQY